MGANGVELDVRLSADGMLVVHHDPDLADGRDIATTPARSLPPHVPFLEPVLDVCGEMIINIEIKNSRHDPGHDPSMRSSELVTDLVRARGISDRVIVSSFSLSTIDRVAELSPGLATAFLTERGVDAIDLAVDHGHRIVHPYVDAVDLAYMEAARAADVEVNVWTVDDPDRIRELPALGVDGICTNVPDVALAVVRER